MIHGVDSTPGTALLNLLNPHVRVVLALGLLGCRRSAKRLKRLRLGLGLGQCGAGAFTQLGLFQSSTPAHLEFLRKRVVSVAIGGQCSEGSQAYLGLSVLLREECFVLSALSGDECFVDWISWLEN